MGAAFSVDTGSGVFVGTGVSVGIEVDVGPSGRKGVAVAVESGLALIISWETARGVGTGVISAAEPGNLQAVVIMNNAKPRRANCFII